MSGVKKEKTFKSELNLTLAALEKFKGDQVTGPGQVMAARERTINDAVIYGASADELEQALQKIDLTLEQ